MIKAVIFDMDGVIIDSEPMHKEVNFELFKQYKINVTSEEYNTYIGMSNKDYWSAMKSNYNLKQSVEDLIKTNEEQNFTHLKNSNAKPISGIVPLLKELKENNVKIGIASSSSLELIYAVVDKLEIRSFFDSIISGQDLQNGKPAPDIFLKSSRELNTDPVNCAVIEDSKNGVTAAKAANMICAGFQNINSGNQDLSLADVIVDDINKINLKLLNSI